MFQLLKQFFFTSEPYMRPNTISFDEDEVTGDMILDLSAVIDELQWREGDELDVQVQGDAIVIKNLTKHPELF